MVTAILCFGLAACADDRLADGSVDADDDESSEASDDPSDDDDDDAGDDDDDGDDTDGEDDHEDGDPDDDPQSDDDENSEASEDSGEESGDENDQACAATLEEIAVYQVVKTSLMKDGTAAEKTVDIVANKKAIVRAFVAPLRSARRGKVRGRLTLTNGSVSQTYEDEITVSAASTDGDLGSTLNFRLEPGDLVPETKYRLELLGCDDAAWPPDDEESMGVRRTGKVKIMLVPVVSSTNGGEPNTSQELQEAFADEVLAMYPSEEVDIQMHDTFKTDIDIGKGFDTWEDLLGELRELKQSDGLDSNLHYYGLLAPEGAGGAGGLAGPGWGNKEGGVGTGFGTQPSFHDWIFAHELGHMHSRWHAPCGGAAGADEDYPYEEAAIGKWGMDIRTEELKDPDPTLEDKNSDLMSYCHPSWISDYQYNALAEKIVDLADYRGETAEDVGVSTQEFRMLIVSQDGRSRWGRPIARAISAREVGERAEVLDESGAVVAETTVYRMRLNDSGGSIVDVPLPQANWHSVRIHGASELRFAQPASSSGLVRMDR
jgi:hypothetical protein